MWDKMQGAIVVKQRQETLEQLVRETAEAPQGQRTDTTQVEEGNWDGGGGPIVDAESRGRTR